MPRIARVSTIHGETFELQDKRFVGDFYSASRGGFRALIAKLDKVAVHPESTQPGVSVPFGSLAVRFDGIDTTATKYDARTRAVVPGGIAIGCMLFDKANLNKIRKWANAAAKPKSVAKAA